MTALFNIWEIIIIIIISFGIGWTAYALLHLHQTFKDTTGKPRKIGGVK